MKAYFYTLGCKVNQYETQEISETLSANGIFRGKFPEDADIIVVNSCTVTQESTRKTKQAVRRFKAKSQRCPRSDGLPASGFPDEAEALEEIDVLLGNKNNHDLLTAVVYLQTGARVNNVQLHEIKKGDEYKGVGISSLDEHTRAYLKIRTAATGSVPTALFPPQGDAPAQSRWRRLRTSSAALPRTAIRKLSLWA